MADRKYKVKIVIETEMSLPEGWSDERLKHAAWQEVIQFDNNPHPGAVITVKPVESLDEAARRGFGG